jgi:hypothetical protein
MHRALHYAALAEAAPEDDRHRLLRLAYALRTSAQAVDVPLQPTDESFHLQPD